MLSVSSEVTVAVGLDGAVRVTLSEDVPVQVLPLVMLKLAYVPAAKPVAVAVPELTVAENVPPV